MMAKKMHIHSDAERRVYMRRNGQPPGYFHRAPISEDRALRLEMLKLAMAKLPASILINERGRGYSIRDNSLMVAWADDLSKGGGRELVADLTKLFHPDCRALLMAMVMSGVRSSEYTLNLIDGAEVLVSVWFGYGGDKVYEIRIIPM